MKDNECGERGQRNGYGVRKMTPKRN